MKSKDLSAVAYPELALVRKAEKVEVSLSLVTRQKTMCGAIALCVQLSGLDDKEVYMTLGIDAGHWTRIMKGDAHFPVNKLDELMDLCGNESPLLWLAHCRGYDTESLRKRETETEQRLREAEDEIRKLKDDARVKADFMAEILRGRAAA